MRWHRAPWRLALFVLSMLALAAWSASPGRAATIWEDYQGLTSITGSSGQDLAGPNYGNNVGNPASMNNLKTISSNPANAVRTGTSTNVNYLATSGTLCDTTVQDPTGTGAACQADAMGRVIFARIKMPLAGNYTLTIAHDDEVDLDLSSNYTSTAYRTVSYDIPVSSLAAYTANDTTYETVGTTLNSPLANGCALMRLYWNNSGGVTHLRLRWTRPDGVTEFIPASALTDPTTAATGCTTSITTTATSLTLNKNVASRAAAADQFQVSINNGGTLITAATTSGTGTGQQASTGAQIITVGTTYTLTDAMAAGSTNPLSSYIQTIACTRNGVAFTPGGSAPNWTVSATAANQAVVCTITNTARPKLTLVKTVTNDHGGTAAVTAWTLQATGTTSISGTSGSTAVTNASVTAGTYTLSETGGPTGYTASAWTCVGGSLTGSSLTLVNGDSATCTINNNDVQPRLTLVKTVTNDNGGTQPASAWTLSASGPTPISGATGSVAVTNAAVNAGVYTLGETGPAGYAMGAWSCSAGSLSGSSLTLLPGQTASCTVNNNDIAPTITLTKVSTGGVGPFRFNGNNGFGAEQIITTVTSGVAVTAPTRTLTNGGVSTVITETIPTGYLLTGITCSGLGSGGTATPNLTAGTVTLNAAATAIGSTIACTFTNAAAAPAMTINKSWAFAVPAHDANGNGVADAGDIVTYYYDVTNTGNVAILNVSISDVHLGAGSLGSISPASVASLAPAASTQFTSTYTVVQGDIDNQ